MVSVSRGAVARDLAVNARPSRPRVLERLQDKHASPLCHDEPGPVGVERSAGSLRANHTHTHRQTHTTYRASE